jgi:hypothetical protein
MDASLAKPLDRQGYSSAARRWSANASVATLVAGIITFGQWLIIDRPQQDRLSRQGEAALVQADASSLYEKVSTELAALRNVVAEQKRRGVPRPDPAKALTEAQLLESRAFNQMYKTHEYGDASTTLLRIHDTVLSAVCLEQHFSKACDSIDYRLNVSGAT